MLINFRLQATSANNVTIYNENYKGFLFIFHCCENQTRCIVLKNIEENVHIYFR